MPILGTIKSNNVDAKLWVLPHEVESGALDQIRNVSSLEPTRAVSIMPDVHLGKGACIGSVIAMEDAVAPSLTGVDIGCGMVAMKLDMKKEDLAPHTLQHIYDDIQKKIPTGFNSRENPHERAACSMMGKFSEIASELQELRSTAEKQLGTLGGGNHFIELSYDDFHNVWIMLHSGSRNIGYKIADHHIRKAMDMMPTGLPDKWLAYFNSDEPEFHQYLNDMAWAQEYALLNREIMLWEVFSAVDSHMTGSLTYREIIQCHHNFAQKEEHEGFDRELVVVRKGAIQAKDDQWGIIPGAMGRDSFIVKGKGNKDSLNSAPHGAGRKMSRSKAKKTFTVDQLEESLTGIIARKDRSVLDEISGSYKDIWHVMKSSEDLVDEITKLNQMLCVKG